MGRRVLVFGSTGQLGRCLQNADWPADTAATFLGREAADFCRSHRPTEIVRREKPHLVIIAAAYADVDGAEGDEATAMLVNAYTPGVIAQAASELPAPIVYLSTDYVFDGTKDDAYQESDTTSPINAYGRSKLAGEVAIRAANPRHLILRTSWLYSAYRTNFLRTMLRLAKTKVAVQVVDDQHGCPTSAHDLADAIARIVPRLCVSEALWGTYHLAGASATNWHGFAEAIFRELAKRGERRPRVQPVSSAALGRLARRPANSRLSSALFENKFGFRLPGFEAAMPDVLDELITEQRVA
jgi:dTDP-4-dehydrorhamnose reductase